MEPGACENTLGTDAIPTAAQHPFVTAAQVVVPIFKAKHTCI